MRRSHTGLAIRIVVAASIALGGCGALIGTRDLEFDPSASSSSGGTEGGSDGPGSADSPSGTDGPNVDGGDGGPCTADTTKDPKNCGRCGHDCLGGECKDSKCEAVRVGALIDTPLGYVTVSSKYIYVSTRIALTTEKGGIFRFPKDGPGGTGELFVDIRYAQAMAIVGSRLYFLVEDDPANDVDKFGGFYSCALDAPGQCTPTRHAVADNPRALTAAGGKLYYGESATGSGMREFTPPSTNVLFRDGYNPPNLYVDGPAAFYSVSVGGASSTAKVIEVFPDAGYTERTIFFSGFAADVGDIFGSPQFVIATAYDGTGSSERGIVRRLPRVGSVSACDFASGNNKRAYGVWADEKRVYWTNEGTGTDHPYTGGSLSSCDINGCCTTAETLWSGVEPRAITGDAVGVYWVSRTEGAVWKLAKP